MTHEEKFFKALENLFFGTVKDLEGDSGYVELMRIKSKYYLVAHP